LPPRKKKLAPARRKPLVKRIIYWLLSAVAAFYLFIALLLVALRWVNPPFTAVQAERRIDAILHGKPYQKRYHFVSLARISPNLLHAVISAEDTRFYHHHGFDWNAISQAIEQDLEDGPKRGASTITQQLVRNLFLSTSRSFVRKGLETSIVPLAELILPKNRILELYLNVVEYGPGIYGCDAASRYYFSAPASGLTRDQSIHLVEVLPAPLHWKPGQKPKYGARISQRMHQAGW
jgi:monofunctional biosynthetic peptidoglycan transglycosylase